MTRDRKARTLMHVSTLQELRAAHMRPTFTDNTSLDAVKLSWQSANFVRKRAARWAGGRSSSSDMFLHQSTNLADKIMEKLLPSDLAFIRVQRGQRGGCKSSTVPAAACASPRSLCCFLAAWHRLPGPPMETSRTLLPIGCQCLSLDQIAGSQSRTAAGSKAPDKPLCYKGVIPSFFPQILKAAKLLRNLSCF